MNCVWKAVVVVVAVVGSVGLLVGSLTAAEAASDSNQEPWQDLFNGKDFDGWQTAAGQKPGEGWVVEDSAMCRKAAAGDIWTKDRFGDFVLDLEFKTEGNSGVFIRTDNPRDCVQTGIEIQVYKPAGQPSKHSCGAVYDAVAPSKEMAKDGQWNHLVVTAADNRLTVALNGQQIIDMDLNRWSDAGKNPDGSGNKFRTALKDFKREGHIGFQDHGANVSYRKVKIKPLKKP
ncbi:MAG: DUF1080 domain-containing protein [Pirellulales bacterium]|nr:DUF1080 domain-containing protein [Pirellulales bacterium]